MITCEEVDLEPGSPCPQPGCDGKMTEAESRNCSCHISPPCSSCVDAGYVCTVCKWESNPYEVEIYEPPVRTRVPYGSRAKEYTSTETDNPFNSTPFTRCCGIAAIGEKRCPHCHAQISWHDDGLAARRREVGPNNCLMCGCPRGNISVRGNCCC